MRVSRQEKVSSWQAGEVGDLAQNASSEMADNRNAVCYNCRFAQTSDGTKDLFGSLVKLRDMGMHHISFAVVILYQLSSAGRLTPIG
jgi:hypothetical protein